MLSRATVRCVALWRLYSCRASSAIFIVLSNDAVPAMNKPLWQNMASSMPVSVCSSAFDKPAHGFGRDFLSSNEPGSTGTVWIIHCPDCDG